jgi:hypothetical protein
MPICTIAPPEEKQNPAHHRPEARVSISLAGAAGSQRPGRATGGLVFRRGIRMHGRGLLGLTVMALSVTTNLRAAELPAPGYRSTRGELTDSSGRHIRWDSGGKTVGIYVDGIRLAGSDLPFPIHPRQRFRIGTDEVFFFDYAGGTACPNQYRVLTTSSDAAILSEFFGSCGEMVVREADGGLDIAIDGACHAIDDDEELAACNASMASNHRYENRAITDIADKKD